MGVNMCEVGVVIELECFGFCEFGISVNLEGIVWYEIEEGVLVVNVMWRNKMYVGILLDCIKYDWVFFRFCELLISDLEMRGGWGRGKRVRFVVVVFGFEVSFMEFRGL